ncbi:hypothetical protein [Phocaeicola plebeius]|uniref:hypothetical protein n=1 Tax=Phocaeicola plebeius TaxID=310297 RepID=UPI0026F07436|nr:hypothetical protein [Phocaeicola plebeius]MCI6049204.1 hypothetical protein [Phocaeicola plebeius]MDD6912883.1 hypothetical protein [Phocaeicola plebeius]MDY5978707.1 hypothetical protein [Phocaeicola plebeius]
MRKLERYLGIVLLVLLTGMVCSCGKERLSDTSSERVNVILNFDTRVGDSESVAIDEGEGIRTLRIIITDENNQVIDNIWRDYSSEGTLTASKTLTIMGLEAGIKKFYVVINEKSIGLFNYLNGINTVLPSGFTSKVIQNTTTDTYFPRMASDIKDAGVPATGMIEVNLNETDNTFTIPCVHTVIKVELNIKNLMNVPCPISAINFGSFVPNATYLFDDPDAEGKSVNLPEGTTISNLQYDEPNGFTGISLPANMSNFQKVLVFYMFEPKVDTSEDFSIALTAAGFESLSVAKSFISQTEIPRNSLLRINATIDLQNEVTIDYKVLPWDKATVKVPGFN